MKKILVIASDGAEEIELYTVADILVRAELDVTIAGVESLTFKGSRGLPIAAEVLLSQVINNQYDLIYLPGGIAQAATMQDNLMVQDMIKTQMESHRLLAIICASPIALIPHKLAANLAITSYPTFRESLEPHVKEWRDEKVVYDSNLITSQGPGTAIDLGLKLVEILAGPHTRDTVQEAILAE